MLKYELYDYIFANIDDFLPKDYPKLQMTISENIKDNIIYDNLVVKREDYNMGPAINVSRYYERHESGENPDYLVKELGEMIVDAFDSIEKAGNSQKKDLLENIYEKVRFRLINTKKNKEYLKNLPHRSFKDLSVVYMIDCSLGFTEGSITINNQIMDMKNLDITKLHAAAIINTYDSENFVLESLSNMFGINVPPEYDVPLYILSLNVNEKYGSAAILYDGLLDMASEKVGGSYYVLPSSMCEVLLIKKEDNVPVKELYKMVKEVNASEGVGDLYLSDSVYEYDINQRKLVIASDSKERSKDDLHI